MWWADVAFWAIVHVAVGFVNIASRMCALWASACRGAEDHIGTRLLATGAICVAGAIRSKASDAHLSARLSVALTSHWSESGHLALLATILCSDEVHVPGRLLASSTCCSACAIIAQHALAINRAGSGAIACCSVAGLVAIGAGPATVGLLVGDGVGALSHTVAARGGAGTKLRPGALAVLGAAMLVAGLRLDLIVRVRALFATMQGRLRDFVCAPLLAKGTTVATICARLVALIPLSPVAFAINWARVGVALLVLDVCHVLTLAPTELGLDVDDVFPRLTATTTVRAAVAILGEVALAINWAWHVTAHL